MTPIPDANLRNWAEFPDGYDDMRKLAAFEILAWREHGRRLGFTAGIVTGKWQIFETDAELARLGHPAFKP